MIESADWRRWSVFEPLPTAQGEALFKRAELKRCSRGNVLFRQGKAADAVWVVLEGWVHLLRTPTPGDDAHAVVLFTVTRREVFCGISAIDRTPYAASGLVGADATVVRIPAGDFDHALRQSPEFAYRVLRLYTKRIRLMIAHGGLMAEPVPRRIVHSILRLRQQFGDRVPVTHRELAQMSWTTTESAIRVVRKLKASGYVSGRRGELTVRQLPALEQLAHQDNGRARSQLSRSRSRE